ncbi:MAG TPA: methyltransferase [Micromonosporaceae bacterium]
MSTDTHVSAIPDAGKIIELSMAFCASKVLHGAVEVGLFAELAKGPATGDELRERLGLAQRATADFLQALVRMNLIERTGGGYANTPLAARYLVPGEPHYLGHFLDRTDRVLYPAWGSFQAALRTGEAQLEEPRNPGNMFVNLYRDPDAMRHFLAMMDALTGVLGPQLAEAFEWSRYGSVVDVGGARGNLIGHLVRAHPHLTATVFDLPPVAPAFAERMEVLGLTGRVDFVGGDFFTDPLPEADVIVLGHVLEDWSTEQKQLLIKQAFQAIRPGGALLVYDPMLDEELSSLVNTLTSLTMLVVTRGGAEYTSDECRQWMVEAGFTDPSARPLGSSDILVVGRKKG